MTVRLPPEAARSPSSTLRHAMTTAAESAPPWSISSQPTGVRPCASRKRPIRLIM